MNLSREEVVRELHSAVIGTCDWPEALDLLAQYTSCRSIPLDTYDFHNVFSILQRNPLVASHTISPIVSDDNISLGI